MVLYMPVRLFCCEIKVSEKHYNIVSWH